MALIEQARMPNDAKEALQWADDYDMHGKVAEDMDRHGSGKLFRLLAMLLRYWARDHFVTREMLIRTLEEVFTTQPSIIAVQRMADAVLELYRKENEQAPKENWPPPTGTQHGHG